VSRVDFAVDCELDSPMTLLSRQIYRDAGHTPPSTGRAPTRSLIVSGDGGSTVYIGARASEQYGRVYDKGIESKACKAGLWWRWEVEFKGSQSWNRSQLLRSVDDPAVLIMSTVASWFRVRSQHSFTSTCVPLNFFVPAEPTGNDRRLKWLSHDVRPTVQRLVDAVGLPRVLAALGLPPQSVVDPVLPSTTIQECA
jgi:hypothetical protein